MNDISVAAVSGKESRNDFIQVPFSVFAGDPNWVPPLDFERREHLDPGKNPYFKHAETELFVAYKGDKPVGRISAQIDRLHLEKFNDATGQFGFFDTFDDQAVANELIRAAEAWLRKRGMRRVQGPFSFSINDETGLLIDGFDTPPCIMMGHARPYMAGLLEALGYVKAKDVIAYDYDGSKEMPRGMQAMIERANRSSDLKIRPLSKKNLAHDLDIIMKIHADAWSDNWGAVPFTQDEINTLGNNLKILVSGEFIAIAEYRGQPVAMAVTLPDINEWLRDLNGKLLPFNWLKLAYRFFTKPPSAVRMPLMGVIKQYHGTPLGSAFALSVIDNLRRFHLARGVRRGELSWILEDNMPMRRIIEGIGATPYKTYRVFEKVLA